MTMPARMAQPASWAFAASGDRGIARNVMPKALTNVAAARPPVRASAPTPSVRSTATDARELATPGRNDWKSSHSLTNPLNGGSAAMDERADEEGRRRPRHPLHEAAEAIDVPLARRVQHGARAEEEHALEGGVVHHVQEGRGEGQRGRRRLGEAEEQEPGARPEHDQPHVLDRRVREQALQVVVDQRVEHAGHGRHGAGGDEQDAPPGGPAAEQIKGDAQQAVDPQLDHHRRHEGRHVAWRGWMGARQPDVHGHEAGLRAETEQGQEENRVARSRGETAAPSRSASKGQAPG